MLVMPCFCSTSTTSSQQSAMVMEAVSTGDLGMEVDSLFSGVVLVARLILLAVAVARADVRNQFQNRVYDGVFQIFISPPDNQNPKPRILNAPTHRLSLRAPRLSAASRASVTCVLHSAFKEPPLRLTVRASKIQRDRSALCRLFSCHSALRPRSP